MNSRKHTIVVSDIHLSQAHPDDGDPLWMRYRRREFHPDSDFAALVDHLLVEHRDDAIEVVFNGDLFDFDAPKVVGHETTFDEWPPDEAGCTQQVHAILQDHEIWFRAAARLLVRGHRVLFLSGNHDVELYWPAVRREIREDLLRLCALESKGTSFDREDLASRIRFRAWFHVTEDRLYFEHGSQYDPFNGVRHAMIPLTADGKRIHPVFGKLVFKRAGARMGYFNAYFEDTFYTGFFGWLTHFLKHYAFTKRHIGRVWFMAAVTIVSEIWRHRHDADRDALSRKLAHEETGAAHEAIDATHALRVRSAEETMFPIFRELWVDRVVLGLAMLASMIVVAVFASPRTTLVALAAMVAAFVLYELFVPKPDVRTYDSAPPEVLAIFDIHDVRAICMGHTHRPFGRWLEKGRFHGNSGSWSPAFRDAMCTEPVLDGRPVLMLTTEGDELHGGLFWWKAGKLVPDPEHARVKQRTKDLGDDDVPVGEPAE